MKYKRRPRTIGFVRADGATGLMSNDTKQGLLNLRLFRKKTRRYN